MPSGNVHGECWKIRTARDTSPAQRHSGCFLLRRPGNGLFEDLQSWKSTTALINPGKVSEELCSSRNLSPGSHHEGFTRSMVRAGKFPILSNEAIPQLAFPSFEISWCFHLMTPHPRQPLEYLALMAPGHLGNGFKHLLHIDPGNRDDWNLPYPS